MREGEGVAEAVTTASFMRCKCNGCTMVSKTIREGSTPSHRVSGSIIIGKASALKADRRVKAFGGSSPSSSVQISLMEVCGMTIESMKSEKAWNRAIVKAEQEAAKKKMERLAKMRAKSKRK